MRTVHAVVDPITIRSYLASREVRKLHIGSGGHCAEGWLNCDLLPFHLSEVVLDATRRFPFPNESFDFIYSEHMIEHVSFLEGAAMLRECFRVMRPGGVVRISTPRLGFLLDLFQSDQTDIQSRYLRWATEAWSPWAPEPRPCFVFNSFVRSWGHQFIYDEETLSRAMQVSGFITVIRCESGDSRHEALRGLENEQRLPEGFLRLETMVLEGTKPTSATAPR